MRGLSRYGAVLAPPGARPALVASIVGRLSLAMNGLAVLLLAKEATGSYAQAGLISAVLGVCFAVVAPARARAADRVGPVPVLRFSGVAHPLSIVAFVVLAEVSAPLAALLVASGLIGATVPPLGSVMRALWGRVVDSPLLPAAYSLESVAVELCFVTGPLLVAALASASGPALALLVSGGFASLGSFRLAGVPFVRGVVGHESRASHLIGPLVSPLVRLNLLTMFCIGMGFGSAEVAAIAFVEEQGRSRAVAGVVLALWSLGSMVGGLVYGSLHLTRPAIRQLPLLMTALAVVATLPSFAGSILALSLLMAAYGSFIAPFFACNSLVLGEAAPEGTVTEAFAWSGSAIFGGAAAGTALAGLVIEAQGGQEALRIASVTAVVAAAITVLGLRRLASRAAATR
jgi:MFS family permease